MIDLRTRPIALLAAVTLVAAGCSSGTESTRDIDNAVSNPTPTNQLTLSGLVTDNPIVNASVMMRVGGAEFSSAVPTGSGGDFQLTIESDNANALITAEATDMVNGVRLSAVVDTFAGCQAKASNGIVNGVKITNVTTAHKVLAERLAADGSIDSFAEFSNVSEMIDANELFDLSSAIKVVIENIDGNTLPAGVADTEALAAAIASGSSSFFNDLAVLSPGAMEEARNRLLSDGNATLPFDASGAPGVYLSTNEEFVYVVFANGTAYADFYTDDLVPGVPSWSLDAQGKLNINFYEYARSTDSLSLLGQVGDLMHVVTDTADFNGADAGRLAASMRKYEFGAGFDAASVAGTWVESVNAASQWVFDAAGTGYLVSTETMTQSDDFAWSVSDGRLVVEFGGNDDRTEIVNLAGDSGMAVRINRFGNLYSTVNVGGWQRVGGS